MTLLRATRRAIRRFFWRHIARYHYEICGHCGGRVSPTRRGEPLTYWQATDDLWLRVNGHENGVLCPSCFTRKAWAKSIFIQWGASDDIARDQQHESLRQALTAALEGRPVEES